MGRGRLVLAAVLATTFVVGGAVYAYLGYARTDAPETAIRAYFAALARADAPAALALGTVPSGSRAFLTSDVLRIQQELAPLTDVTITGTERSGSRATVRFSYQLRFPARSQEISGGVAVTERDGTWRLAATAVAVQVGIDAASSRATLAGAAVPDAPVLLFPGAAPIRFDSAHLAAAPGAAASFGGASEVKVGVELSDAGRAAIQPALTRRLRECAANGAGPGCPLPDDPHIVPGTLRGSFDASDVAGLDYSVRSSASGTIAVDGLVGFTGRWGRLGEDNRAHDTKGAVRVHVAASTPAAGVVRLRFLDPSA